MVCCEALEQLEHDYDLPFVKPLFIVPETHDLKVGSIAIALRTLTRAGNISRKGRATMMINFCPICGTDLRPDEHSD